MIKNDIKYVKELIKSFYKSLGMFFVYKDKYRKYSTKKILVTGGYGYGNVGDEAQCSATLELLKERYKDYQIINLTPNIAYSKEQHPKFDHDYASRVLLFNQNRIADVYNLDNCVLKKIFFLLKSLLILFNAYLVRADLPVLGINSRVAKFLYELKECSLFYFCGGGFLTGGTLSRLWDGILVCRLCHIFRTPVVMSGQTIGVWRNKFNELFAKWGFKYVNVITVRDEEYSLNDLQKIGLKGERYFATHDDALHCEKSSEKQVNLNDYISLNFHYWGMKEKEKAIYIDKMNKIVDFILEKTNSSIVFIPMHRSDAESFNDYIKKYPNPRVSCFEYDYDFRKVRRVIADSKFCVTMKHHPIIFAMGEGVPVLSLAFSDYYVHKNVGALTQYGQEKCSVNLESENCIDDVKILLKDLIDNSEAIKSEIRNKISILDKRKESFMQEVDKILKV